MEPVTLEHVSVLTSSSSPRDEPLAHAMEWASSLRLPLQILNTPTNGIPCEGLHAPELISLTNQLFRPHDLSVFSSALSSELKNRLVRFSMSARQNAILVCSRSPSSISRALIVHSADDVGNGFLLSTLSLCRLFCATPVILTLATNEIQARQGQHLAEKACLLQRTPALLDYAVGVELRAAVYSIARWRRCSHVFMARRQTIPWWRWLRGDILNSLIGLVDSPTFLVLPEPGMRLPDCAIQSCVGATMPARS
jgi:hypothetical protein